MLFNTEGFWRSIFLFVLGLLVVFFLINTFILKKRSDKAKLQSILINILLGLAMFYLFYRIYKVLDDEFTRMYELSGVQLSATQFFVQNIINNVVQVCVLALATTGIVLIFKTSTTTNFAQGMLATFGAFMAAKLVIYFTTKINGLKLMTLGTKEIIINLGTTEIVLLAMLGGALAAFLLGIAIDVFIIRQSKMPTAVGKQMITMGLVLVLMGALPLIFGSVPLNMPVISNEPNIVFQLGAQSYNITSNAVFALGITVVLLVVLFSMLRFTKWGLGVRATASNEVVASMMGVNTRVITAMSWGIAGFLGGVAAVILAPNKETIEVVLMTPTQVNGFMAAILGSFGSFTGPLLASILIPVLTGLLTIVTVWQSAVVYLIILAIVLVKPLGLFGKQVAKKV